MVIFFSPLLQEVFKVSSHESPLTAKIALSRNVHTKYQKEAQDHLQTSELLDVLENEEDISMVESSSLLEDLVNENKEN